MSVVGALSARALESGITVSRAPLGVVARVAGGGESWPPAVAYDSAAARVRVIAGSLLDDEDLVRHGRLEQARVDRLRTAAELRARAEQLEGVAHADRRNRRQQADRQRTAAEDGADERRARATRERQARQHQAEQGAARRRANSHEVERETRKAVDSRERAARTRTASSRSRATRAKQQELEAEAGVLAAQRKAAQAKRRRTTPTA